LANTYGFVHEAWEGVQNFLKQLYEMLGSGTTQSLFAIFSLVANQEGKVGQMPGSHVFCEDSAKVF
jgi:hypothetical protein